MSGNSVTTDRINAVHTATNRSKDRKGSECENSTVEGGFLHTVRPEPTSGREVTNRRQNMTRDRRQTEVRSEVFT
jgi:hypothetical protein